MYELGTLGWSLVTVAVFIYVCLGVADLVQRVWNWTKKRRYEKWRRL